MYRIINRCQRLISGLNFRASHFAGWLKQIYSDANCKKFFKEHEGLYKTAQENLMPVYEASDVNWSTNKKKLQILTREGISLIDDCQLREKLFKYYNK
jgi:hypothetical protein